MAAKTDFKRFSAFLGLNFVLSLLICSYFLFFTGGHPLELGFAAVALVSNTAMIYAPLALAKLHDASGLGLAHEFIRSSDPMLKNQAADTIAAAGDEKSVALLEELIAAEPDQNNRNMLDYAKQRLSARLKNLQKK